ncbi:MAG: hypothetical protein CO108_22355 [Deltaproteobacteria bacterium CG_4_9_14_3_um_filter_63_12]|nr:MAG: hypothetical protein CO108_22355 [Deltaproteobacteria bacterium CG_4_9_14_3_um_filter_63_12]
MRTLLSLVLFAFALMLTPSCVRTVYVVKTPGGDLAEVTREEALELQGDEPGTPERADEADKKTVVDPLADADLHTLLVDPNEVLEEELVILDVQTANPYVMVGDDGPLYLQVTVGAKDYVAANRAAMNLSIVIDRSGSMAGTKMQNVKAAASWLVSNLSENDHVAIVSYSSDVRIDGSETLSKAGRARLLAAIEGISDGGGTNLSGGLVTGASTIAERFDGELLNRVILLSDGNANEGITDARELGRISDKFREQGISVTTMGVGLDYNEDLMEKVATLGGGNYYFIEDAVAVAAIFDQEMALLGNTVVRDAVVDLELPDGVKVDDVYGYNFEQNGSDLKVYMNSVSSGQERRLLVALDVPKEDRAQKKQVVKSGSFSYRNEAAGKDMKVDLPPVEVNYTDDASLVASNLNAPVIEKVETVRNAQLKQQVFEQLDMGNRAAAQELVANRKKEAAATQKVVQSEDLDRQFDDILELEASVDEVPAAPAAQQSYRSSGAYKSKKKSSKAEANFDLAY